MADFKAQNSRQSISYNRIDRNNLPEQIEDLSKLVNSYLQRNFDEDISYLENKIGGIEGLVNKLRVNFDTGLSTAEIDIRKQQLYGINLKDNPVRTPFFKFFLEGLDNFMIKMLLICACINIGFEVGFAKPEDRTHTWIEGFSLFLAVLIVVFIPSYINYKKEDSFFKLHQIQYQEKLINCIRNGKEQAINSKDIVIGDVLKIQAGMDIPVDGLVIQASNVQVYEGLMTGESDLQQKDSLSLCQVARKKILEQLNGKKGGCRDIPSPILISGTQIAIGEGWFVAIVVGKKSVFGGIKTQIEQNSKNMTPLQIKLIKLGQYLGTLGIIAALLTLHVLLLRFFIEKFVYRTMNLYENDSFIKTEQNNLKKYLIEWLKYLIFAISIIIIALPEGLPLVVMITIAYSVRKMLMDQNLVKKLASCEVMAGVDTICTDMTGTLTMNKMTVTNIYIGVDRALKIQDSVYKYSDYFTNKYSQIFQQAVACNTSGLINSASATDQALLIMMMKFKTDVEELRRRHLPKDFTRFHLTSKRKIMSSIIQNCGKTENNYDRRIHMKGGAEIVLECCSHYLNTDGQKTRFNNDAKQRFINIINTYGNSSLRTISFAYKDLKPNEGGEDHKNIGYEDNLYEVEKENFTLICIIGIKDIIRPEVPISIAQFQKAGISVRMVTGDNIITAKAVARECNILNYEFLNKPDSIMEGHEFYQRIGGVICHNCNQMSPCYCDRNSVREGVKNLQAFKALHKNLVVLARSRPEDKYLLLTGLKEVGEVVAVTGDGIDEVPSLKKADVSFAMGITGTQIAKNVADIIIMDDNFNSILKTCLWGRNIYENIQKFLQFHITVSLVAIFTAFFGSIVLQESPLQPIQLLWINLIIDSLAVVAFASELPTIRQYERPPRDFQEHIISRKMLKQIVFMTIYMIVILWAICFGGDHFFPEPDPHYRLYNQTMIERVIGYEPSGNQFVYSGRSADRFYEYNPTKSYLYIDADKQHGASRHLSNVFNIFVVMSIFHLMNCRIIDDSYNIFKGVFNNRTFCLIFFGIFGFQVFIIYLGSDAFQISRGGIHGYHWLIAIMLGLSTWIASALFKLIPDALFPKLGYKNNESRQNRTNDRNISMKSYKKSMFSFGRKTNRLGSIRIFQENLYSDENAGSQRRNQQDSNMNSAQKYNENDGLFLFDNDLSGRNLVPIRIEKPKREIRINLPKFWKFRLPLATSLLVLSFIQLFLGVSVIILSSQNKYNEILLQNASFLANDLNAQPKKLTSVEIFASILLFVQSFGGILISWKLFNLQSATLNKYSIFALCLSIICSSISIIVGGSVLLKQSEGYWIYFYPIVALFVAISIQQFYLRLNNPRNFQKIIYFVSQLIFLSIHIYGLNKAIYRGHILCESFIQTQLDVCIIPTFRYLIFLGSGFIAAINHALFLIIIQMNWNQKDLETVYDKIDNYYKDDFINVKQMKESMVFNIIKKYVLEQIAIKQEEDELLKELQELEKIEELQKIEDEKLKLKRIIKEGRAFPHLQLLSQNFQQKIVAKYTKQILRKFLTEEKRNQTNRRKIQKQKLETYLIMIAKGISKTLYNKIQKKKIIMFVKDAWIDKFVKDFAKQTSDNLFKKQMKEPIESVLIIYWTKEIEETVFGKEEEKKVQRGKLKTLDKQQVIQGLKKLCLVLNQQRFRTKRWGQIWKNENHLIKEEDLVGQGLESVIFNLRAIYQPYYNSDLNSGILYNKIASQITTVFNAADQIISDQT